MNKKYTIIGLIMLAMTYVASPISTNFEAIMATNQVGNGLEYLQYATYTRTTEIFSAIWYFFLLTFIGYGLFYDVVRNNKTKK